MPGSTPIVRDAIAVSVLQAPDHLNRSMDAASPADEKRVGSPGIGPLATIAMLLPITSTSLRSAR